jgi:hypothetical protein
MKDILPSMPKGEIVGDMAIATDGQVAMTQMIKVVIDAAIDCLLREQMHDCWNTMLEHDCWKQ